MDLTIQIYSLITSFLFGMIFALELTFFDKLVNKLFFVWKFLLSFIFVMLNAFVYFLILLLINHGILHIYFFISIVIGYYVFYKLFMSLFTHFRKKS